MDVVHEATGDLECRLSILGRLVIMKGGCLR